MSGRAIGGAAAGVLAAITLSHGLNDLLQSLLPAIYPVLAVHYRLSLGQIGAISLVYSLTASVLQPLVGHAADRRALPYSLAAGMLCTLAGILTLSRAGGYAGLLAGVAAVGVGSAVFHPESSRVARLASGGRPGFAQSVFQVGGNAGASLGPLAAAFVVAPFGVRAVAWFGAVALAGSAILAWVGRWYAAHARARAAAPVASAGPVLAGARVRWAMALLVLLMVSKFFYMASMGNYYTFYLIHRFHVPVQTAQLCLFVFQGSVAVGTLLGGPVGDVVGRRRVILVSILGVLPFTLLLPYVGFGLVVGLTVPIGLLIASAFPAIVVFAQDLMPARVGTVSGLMFGLAFGAGGIGAALLGQLADRAGIDVVFRLCALLPVLGVAAVWLPEVGKGLRRPGALGPPSRLRDGEPLPLDPTRSVAAPGPGI